MAQITFYYQVRNDGGVRTGIQIDGRPAWMHFLDGSRSDDPALLWYVDVEFEADKLSDNPEAARDRFVQFADQIGHAIQNVIDALRNDEGTLAWPISSRPILLSDGVVLKTVCSAIRRISAIQLASELSRLRVGWHQQIDRLEPISEVASK